jgi:hypothetical protein
LDAEFAVGFDRDRQGERASLRDTSTTLYGFVVAWSFTL